jgi:PAS domain-containing protein
MLGDLLLPRGRRRGIEAERQESQRFMEPATNAGELAKGWKIVEPRGRDERRTGVRLDITERKRAEEKLREGEDQFCTMANTVPAMIWASGTDQRCTFFNKGWLDFTGRSLEQELGNGWSEGIYKERRPRPPS